MQRIGDAGADAPWERGGLEIFYVDYRAARDHAILGMDVFHPRHGIAVGGNGGLLEGVRGKKRLDHIIERSTRVWFLCGPQALFDVLSGAGFFLREGVAGSQKQRNCHHGGDARTQNHYHVLSNRFAVGTVIRAGMEGKRYQNTDCRGVTERVESAQLVPEDRDDRSSRISFFVCGRGGPGDDFESARRSFRAACTGSGTSAGAVALRFERRSVLDRTAQT